MRKFAFIILLGATVIASCNNSGKTETKSEEVKTIETQSAALYLCPMDCEKGKTYDNPGKCPVCGMDLEKK